MKKPKRTQMGLDGYRESGEAMRKLGYRAIREVQDHDGNSCLTFWGIAGDVVITQAFWDTGDVNYYILDKEMPRGTSFSAKA